MNNITKYTLAILSGLTINGVLPNSELWLNYLVGIKIIALIILIFLMMLSILVKTKKEVIPTNWFRLFITVSLIINAIVFGYVGYAVVSIIGLILITSFNKLIIKEK